MHFTIERKRLIKMLEHVRRKLPGQKGKDKNVRLYACAARVFVEANSVTAGEESLVLEDGGCLFPLETFLALLRTYPKKKNVTIQADATGLRLFTTTMPVFSYTKNMQAPADFFVGSVNDEWVASRAASSPRPPA